jgi:hypothetical protein
VAFALLSNKNPSVPVWLLNTPLLKILRPGNDEGRPFLKQHQFQYGDGWQFSHTNARRPLISKRLISPLQSGHVSFAKILKSSRYLLLDLFAPLFVKIALCFTPSVSRAFASFQIRSNVCLSIFLPSVSGCTAWRHKISVR